LIIGGMLPQLRLLDKLQIRPALKPIPRTCRRIDEKWILNRWLIIMLFTAAKTRLKVATKSFERGNRFWVMMLRSSRSIRLSSQAGLCGAHAHLAYPAADYIGGQASLPIRFCSRPCFIFPINAAGVKAYSVGNPHSIQVLEKYRTRFDAVTNARFASLRFHANRARVPSGVRFSRSSGGFPSAARRRRCAPPSFPPSLRLRSTVPARRPQTETFSKIKRN